MHWGQFWKSIGDNFDHIGDVCAGICYDFDPIGDDFDPIGDDFAGMASGMISAGIRNNFACTGVILHASGQVCMHWG